MFARARRRLALRYLAMLVVVLVAFSVVFLVVLAIALQPDFDIAPEIPDVASARQAYTRTVERIAVALVLADLTVVAVIGVAGYYLADRTLRPIRIAHDRQRRFVADASHEMRTPLAVIRGTAEAAMLRDTEPLATREALDTIVASTDHLSHLTSDLLVLARSERTDLVAPSEPVDLSVVVAEEIERARIATAPARRAIDVTLASDLVVGGDPAEIGRIIANLIDNAFRYGAEPVGVHTFEGEGKGIVEVTDHGPGIAAADQEHIFEPFYRVRSDAGAPDGTGLGLAIAAELARQHGGQLRVASQPGQGATFRLEIPRLK